ncbi:ATP-binding protein involved in chromosome partitioning [Orenia metallireducens]|jgi:ATP-binding protein involved in chromosome partitioning|uniref:Iron-sulfur cluster carrier protein n=1 Tax=Orenia metallireducens TaxID=1413210 RepID=A0A285G987_9FIRM|nr:Mrp/NBP35 family ATP-binding protein [Orenia metallireducens]PRX24198.1 ATP-binding protein involved in chromosome partitioning [Orenia metallireducens]SNY19694.1 ATP-binding protein involved in chromosome partitioning [Orenia metallireducens]
MEKMYSVEDGWFKLEHGLVNEGLIAIASGKGGVGKSTVTVNLALALHKLGRRVGIIDADIHGFSIPRIIGLTDKPRAFNEKEIIPPEVNGVKVMSAGSMIAENKAIIWRAPMLLGVLEQFMKDVHWGELDYLLFDLPPGTGDMPLNIMQQISDAGILIVTTPQVAATKVASRVGSMAKQLDSDILGIIENMSYYQCDKCGDKEYIFGQGGGQKMAKELDSKLLTQLPLMATIRQGSDQGKPVVIAEPEAEATQKFIAVAEKLIAQRAR